MKCLDEGAGQSQYPQGAVVAALNRAADDILEAIDAPDEGARDLANLLVNVTVAYLDGSASTLTQAIEQSYDADPEEVLEWCKR